MSEHTQTLWVILQTPQKKLLTRISSLHTRGKMMIDEMKVAYGKKKTGEWLFQVLGQPKSRTFSFHDGDVIQKIDQRYVPLRNYSFRIFWMILSIVSLGYAGVFLKQLPVVNQVQSKPVEMPTVQVQPVIEEKKISVKKKQDPKVHDVFLQAKRDFQYGRLEKSIKVLKKNINMFDASDLAETTSMLSEFHYIDCQKKLKEHEERKAVIACEKAVKLSSHAKAETFLSQQDERARKLYLDAYTVQKFDPKTAKQKYALVLQSAQSKSTWRSKAQYQLRKLNSQI